MAFKTVTLTPTLSTDAYADGDVLFLLTEINLPARSAKLIGGAVVDYAGTFAAEVAELHFFQNNAAELGSINATANITDANFRLNRYQGSMNISSTATVNELDNMTLRPMVSAGGTTIALDGTTVPSPVVMTSTKAGHKIFVSGIVSTVSTAAAMTADNLEIVLYFEH